MDVLKYKKHHLTLKISLKNSRKNSIKKADRPPLLSDRKSTSLAFMDFKFRQESLIGPMIESIFST
jgi:hypothetical protein